METIFEKILEYSLSIAILLGVVWYFAQKNDKKDEKIYEMHKEFVKLIEKTNETMQKSCAEMIKKLENISKK